MTKIYEVLARDPRSEGLANDGQARIRNEHTTQADAELRAELSSFVCDGQYGSAMDRILSGYLKHLTMGRQLAAWVSGFFGSGKSHLLKMLGHLWMNTAFADGNTARNLVVGLPSEVAAHLRELDQTAKRLGVRRFAAMGQLPAGSGDFVRATIASIVLDAAKLPTQIQLADFVFWLRREGIEEAVRAEVEKAGKNWLSELESLYVSPVIARAVLNAMPKFAATEADARKAFGSQFPALKQDLDTARFVKVIRSAIEENGKLPLTVIVLDEVQQYIADSSQRSTEVTEAIEALYTQFDSRVLVIGAGQSALSTNTQYLIKLRDRFHVTVELSDSDVEAVTRKVVLSKKPTHTVVIQSLLDQHAGEVSRHFSGSPRLAARTDDSRTIVTDYPLLPSRRRFWEECFRAVDKQGTQSQLRSQLKVLHSCVEEGADRELGYVIPGDALYSRIADKLVNTGVLLTELHTRIAKLDDGTPNGRLRKRVCALVFLIMKLPREAGVDVGARATANVIADLLVEDITVSSGTLRSDVETTLAKLAADGVLMRVGDEYRLQTTEGAEWDRAFRERVTQLSSHPDEIEALRSKCFREEAQRAVGEIRLKHGGSKTPRTVTMHYDISAPAVGGDVVVWVRDGWGASQSEVISAARSLGQDDAIVHVFIPKKEADRLKQLIADATAAQRVLDNKGAGSNREGEEARASILSRKLSADAGTQEVLKDIFRGALVYQSGGNEVACASLGDALATAANASIERLYPRFAEADRKEWPVVIKRAQDGNDNPFAALGFTGPIQEHAVAKEVLRLIGSGSTGAKIRRALEAPPFGWPNEAVAAALIALHRIGIVRATKNGSPIAAGALDLTSISNAEFRLESVVVSVKEKLLAKGVCAHLGVTNVKDGELEIRAGEAIRRLEELRTRVGGEPPLPAIPTSAVLSALLAKSGPDLIVSLAANEGELKGLWTLWSKRLGLVEQRKIGWYRATRLAACGNALPGFLKHRAELDAIQASRTLLDDPDPVPPVAVGMANSLRGELQSVQSAHVLEITNAQAVLNAAPVWNSLAPVEAKRIQDTNSLATPPGVVAESDEDLLNALESLPLDARRNIVALVPTRVAKSLEEATRLLKPSARSLKLTPATLETEAQVEEWLVARRRQLLDAIKRGPVILG